MRKHVLAVLVYVVATFATQAVSHFGVNAAHYGAVTYLRAQPVFALGILSMLIQGSVMAYLYALVPGAGRSIGHAVAFASPGPLHLSDRPRGPRGVNRSTSVALMALALIRS